ncbi:SICAvar, type I [Plasmodium knowlesi strain H]|nr:SICAvar, type I [Plasmodium knowlesi strain H]
MKTNGGTDTNGNPCGTMDDGTTGTGGSRQATDPERKACNYLHAGLTKLYNPTSSTTTSSSSSGPLSLNDKNPLLRQTVGCLLLHSYAKKMKSEAKCLVESGISKAFKDAGSCNGSSGKEPCVPCQWKEDIFTTCSITTTGTGTETADEKLKGVQPQINETSSTTTKENINLTPSLCDQLQCAVPKWFDNQNNKQVSFTSSTTTNMTWCNFWEGPVKEELKRMFNDIATDGQKKSIANTNYATCQSFGDGNADSVERKACNHIAAGLKYIKTKTNSGNDKQLLERAVACIALNLYADQIKKESKEKCPIDEKRIEKMFDYWNRINNNSCSSGDNNCFKCERKADFKDCELSVTSSLIHTTPNGTCNTNATNVKTKMEGLLFNNEDPSQSPSKSISQVKETLSTITNMKNSFCTQLQCAAKQYAKKTKGQSTDIKWNDINSVVEEELRKLLEHITKVQNWEGAAQYCKGNIGPSKGDTPGEKKAKQKACKLFALGLNHISQINENETGGPLRKTMMCAALNLYADQLIIKSTKQCPLDDKKLKEAIEHAFQKGNATMKNGGTSCNTQGNNSCFVCNRQDKNDFANCQIGNNSTDKVGEKMTILLDKEDKSNSQPNTNTSKMEQTLDKINSKDIFCTELQCAIKQHYNKDKIKKGNPTWENIKHDATKELTKLLEHMMQPSEQKDVDKYCKDKEDEWYKLGHKQSKTNKAACLLFASGLKHIYGRGQGRASGPVKGPSFEQTMGCLFLKEYAKQLQKMANDKKRGNSWVHPLCDIDKGIKHAFEQSEKIMKSVLNECKDGPNGISCIVCTQKEDYYKCKIGSDSVKTNVETIFQDDQKQNQMQETLENTVCPILLTDLLTPFLPLAPVSIGLSAMAYYLWKYFGPLGKGGPRFRRSPGEIPGPSVQEQVLDHVQQDSSHEYQLVKERKPRSAPTRTKRSGRVNRRTIIEIHFEVLDECQKGDTQLNQKDFLELLVQEFMGSEFMEEEQVSKEEVLMEGVPMESVPMERVPSLGSGFMV